jgi:replicative superfamily II helicase
VQSQLFFPAFRTDDSILLCSQPTTGKTTVAELAMFHLFTQNPTGKAVYLSPGWADGHVCPPKISL